MSKLTQSPAWQALLSHRDSMARASIRELFAQDRERAERFSVEAAGVFVDYSKNLVTDDTIALLTALARETRVEERRHAMFTGERINVTEDRPVLHVALRERKGTPILVDGEKRDRGAGRGHRARQLHQ